MRVLIALLLLAALPLAGAKEAAPPVWESSVTPDEVDTILYFHTFDLRDMPLNTQVPTYQEAAPSQFGPTLTCLDPVTGDVGGTGVGTGGLTSQELHTYRSFASPSYVEYNFTGDGVPRTRPERGLSYDIPFNSSAPIVLHWFLAEDIGVQDVPGAPTALTNVIVRVVVRAGEAISVNDKAYDTGAIVLDGATEPVTASAGQVTGAGATQVTASRLGNRWVYDFAVPLAPHIASFNRATGFNVRIDVLADNAACEDDGSVMPGTVEVIADLLHQPRIELRHAEPLRVEWAIARAADNGTLLLEWAVSSGWGNYDLALDAAQVKVYGPSDAVPVLQSTTQAYRPGYDSLTPAEQAWTLDPSTLASGRYTVVFTAPNLQRTATAEAIVHFQIQDGRLITGEPVEAPGPGLALLGGLLLVAVAVRRR